MTGSLEWVASIDEPYLGQIGIEARDPIAERQADCSPETFSQLAEIYMRMWAKQADADGRPLLARRRTSDRSVPPACLAQMQVISAGIRETATKAFYRSILEGGDGSVATRAIREALHPNEAVFWTVTVEWLFLEILKAYDNQTTTDEQIAARVERFMAHS